MKLTKKKNGIHSVHFTTEHGRRTLSTGCTNEADAKKVVERAKVKELEMAARSHRLTQHVVTQIVAGKKVTTEQACIEWGDWMEVAGLAPRTVRCTMASVSAWIRDMKLAKVAPGFITEKQVNAWINDADSKTKLGSRKVMLSHIKSFFKFCIAKGYTIANPSALVRVRLDILSHAQKEAKQVVPFTDEQVRKILKHTEEDKDLVHGVFWNVATAIGRYAGLRLGDIAQLEWDCFSRPGVMVVWTDKRDRRVALPLTTELAVAVAKIPVNDDQYCFPEVRAIYVDATKHGWLPTQFRRICEKLKFPNYQQHFHALRHAYASDCVKRGIPMEHIRINMAHAHTDTTKGYIHE